MLAWRSCKPHARHPGTMLYSRPPPTYGLSPRASSSSLRIQGYMSGSQSSRVASFCDWSLPDHCRTGSAVSGRTVPSSVKYSQLQMEKLEQNYTIFSSLTKGEQSIVNGICQNKRDPEREERIRRERARRTRDEEESTWLATRSETKSAPSQEQTVGVFKLPSHHQETHLPHDLLEPRSRSLDVQGHQASNERSTGDAGAKQSREKIFVKDHENRKLKVPMFLHKFCGMDDCEGQEHKNCDAKNLYYNSGKLTPKEINQMAHHEYTAAIERNAKVLLNYKLPNLSKHKTNLRISLTGDPNGSRVEASNSSKLADSSDKKQQQELKHQLGLNQQTLQLDLCPHGRPQFCKRDLYSRFTKPLVRQVSGQAMLPVKIERRRKSSTQTLDQNPFRWLPIITCVRDSSMSGRIKQETPYKMAKDNDTGHSNKSRDAVDAVAAANYMSRKPTVTACPPPNTPVPTHYPDSESDRESSYSESSDLEGDTWEAPSSHVQCESETLDEELSTATRL